MRSILVFEPKFGSRFLHEYFGPLKHFDNVDGAMIYCDKIEVHKKWACEYSIRKEQKDAKPIEVINQKSEVLNTIDRYIVDAHSH